MVIPPDVCWWPIDALTAAYQRRTLRPVDVARVLLGRIAQLNPRLNCFTTVLAEASLAQAEAAERRYRDGVSLGPLDGVPLSLKDNFHVAGAATTASVAVASLIVAAGGGALTASAVVGSGAASAASASGATTGSLSLETDRFLATEATSV